MLELRREFGFTTKAPDNPLISRDVRMQLFVTDFDGSLSLDLAMRPPGETADLGTFAARSGSDPELIRRLWRALGLPESGPVPLRVTPDAAHAVSC